MKSPMHRRAFSLLESVLVVGILVVLIGLIVSSIGPAREAARRLECSHRLQQIGTAIQQNIDAHGVVSRGLYGYEKAPRVFVTTNLNFLVELLPYLGEEELFVRMMADPDSVATLSIKPPAIYWCPSLPGAQWGDEVLTASNGASVGRRYAYAGNRGLDPQFESDWERGVFGRLPVRAKDITDGLANTVALSEIVPSLDSTRYRGWTHHVIGHPKNQSSVEMCGNLTQPAASYQPEVGSDWLMEPYYDHTFPPLSNSCEISVAVPFFGNGSDSSWSTTPANSQHPGGVNVLMCDGSRRFVSSAVDLKVWRAAATRNGGEQENGL